MYIQFQVSKTLMSSTQMARVQIIFTMQVSFFLTCVNWFLSACSFTFTTSNGFITNASVNPELKPAKVKTCLTKVSPNIVIDTNNDRTMTLTMADL